MNGAGQYADRVTWRKRTITKKPDNGQDVEQFADNGQLWASIELTGGRKQTDFGATQTGADAVVRVRNMPTLSALDRLYSAEWGELWVIDHVRRGDNELVCECVKFDALDLGA
ncbi:MAG: head-tail adaptor protein [Gemmataceae bacterium]|nr:head-tail adaptor protein [Gemmataceae bacterium]